jgi:hypothetical protein
MIYFVIAIIFFIVGRYAFPYSSRVVVKNYDNMPGYRTAPPPPPMPKVMVKIGHLEPKIPEYKRGHFTIVNKCCSCGLMGSREEVYSGNPCKLCGAKVYEYGVARWGIVDGMWQWDFSSNI